MSFKKSLYVLLAVASIGLAGCSSPEIKKVGDLDGNGITSDILMGKGKTEWLFLKQKDGSYVRANVDYLVTGNYNEPAVKYFRTEDGDKYFPDGTFYRKYKKLEEKK